MKKIIILLMFVFLTGCSVDYNLNYENGIYKEKMLMYGESNEIIDGESFIDIKNNYFNKNILVDYSIDTGDIRNEDFPLYYNTYNKKIIDDEKNGLLLYYDYSSYDDYKKSTLINELFYDISISDNYLEMKNAKNIFLDYPYLDKIKIEFKTDNYIKDINADEKINNSYYWYFDKNNYKSKSIYIVYATNKLDSIKPLSENNTNKVISVTIVSILSLFLIIMIVTILRIIRSKK